MPTSYIKKLSSEGLGTVKSLESLWSEAKIKAKEAGREKDWAYVMAIFKRMAGLKTAFFQPSEGLDAEGFPFMMVSTQAAAPGPAYFTKSEATSTFFSNLAKKYKISIPEARQRWEYAKDRARREGHPNNVQLIYQFIHDLRNDKDRSADRVQKKQRQIEILKEKSPNYRPAATPPGGDPKLAAPIFTLKARSFCSQVQTYQSPTARQLAKAVSTTGVLAESWLSDELAQEHRSEFVRRALTRNAKK